MEKNSNYFENLAERTKQYFAVLSEEIPDFLYDYVNTPEMQKQDGISVSCGTIYSKLFGKRLWFSSLEHSIGVALIIWHFTKDKKQTLAGLFHDISTPAFKHCIDFMNGDYAKQESTEDLTVQTIRNSKEIMSLLARDDIKLEEVSNYHIYPIADNDTPKLSADRLEYTLSNGFGVQERLWNIEEIRQIYENIEIQQNEAGIKELGFKDIEKAERFVEVMSKLSESYIWNKTLLSMQFLADTMKEMSQEGFITKQDLYELSKKQIIEKVEKCEYGNIAKRFEFWRNAEQIEDSDEPVEGAYCVSINPKKRYIVPLIRKENEFIRINKVSERAKENIEAFLNYNPKKYACLEFKI